MDELKKYLQQHRSEMDEDIPSVNLLQRIHDNKVPVKKVNLFYIGYKIAAAACVLAFIMGGSWLLLHRDKPVIVAGNKNNPVQKDSNPSLTATTNTHISIKTGTVIKNNKPADQTNTAAANLPQQLLQSFSYNYTQLVNLQLKDIRNTPLYGETGDYFNDFKHNLNQMDADEVKIKLKIKRVGLSDVLLEQLINVYQQKINLLKDLQHEISKLNNRVKENQSPLDSVHIHYINI
jgi:hypothetical protein